MPTAKGPMLLVDAGANMDAKAEYLLQFAQMGSIYMEDVLGIKNPRVGLVNVGVEEAKGNQLVKETGPLLKECEEVSKQEKSHTVQRMLLYVMHLQEISF